ncbi:MAG: dephospho-CoA kinase [Pirellulaceae bacterium]
MKTVGILGGIASGKSEVTRILSELGAAIFDGDRAGHEVLRNPAVKERIRQQFGSEVFDPEGEVDRRRLAAVVFANTPEGPAALTKLERITHPKIREMLDQQRICYLKAGNVPLLVLDAPVMIKAGWLADCDHVLFVQSSRENRLARAKDRAWSELEFDAREARQENLDEKRELADDIVNNDQDLPHLRRQVLAVWDDLLD